MIKNDEDIVKIGKALSDKTRVRILKEIVSRESISCGDAEKIAGLSQPTVSHHLKILTDCHLLISEKKGRHITVRVNKGTLKEYLSAISSIVKTK